MGADALLFVSIRLLSSTDRAVMTAYGMDVKTTTESSCVALLLQKYKELTGE